METFTFTALKTKIRAFQNMEKELGEDKLSLNSQEKLERKNIMKKILKLEPVSEKITNFDYMELQNQLNNFFVKMKKSKQIEKVKIQPLPKDMFIKVENNELILEEEFIKNTDPQMVKIIIFHELYHKFGQNMEPNMKEVKYLTDYFGFNSIVELDIDSDIETYQFLKNQDLNFEKYLILLHQNLPDEVNWRTPKIVRLVGSILSIYITEKIGKKVILMPEISDNSKNYLACIMDGRKFVKSSFIKNLAKICCTSSSFSNIAFANSATSLCNKIMEELKPQLNFTQNYKI